MRDLFAPRSARYVLQSPQCIARLEYSFPGLRRGWVLDGFPETPAQADFLRKAHLWPSRVVHLSLPESLCLQRLSLRRVDSATGEAYYSQPPQAAIRKRLVKIDEPEAVSEKYHKHYQNVGEVCGKFERIYGKFSAGESPEGLRHGIQDFVR